MDIFFTDPSEVPLPPNEVRIREFRAEPFPDGKRVRVTLEVDPSQKRPNADLVISDADGEPVATASIIESMDRKMEITMHLRIPDPQGRFAIQASLFFAEINEPPENGPTETEPALQPIERLVVDHAQATFVIPPPEDGAK